MGKNISQDLKHAIEMFYQSDKFSRMHPGEKEYVSVKIVKQLNNISKKRLLLTNLKELYLEFLKQSQEKIVFQNSAS